MNSLWISPIRSHGLLTVLSLALRGYPSGILYPGCSKFHSRGDKMCRGCFNPLILHKDCFEGGSDRLFDHVAASPTRRNFMAYSAAAAAATE
jgi:hypothetical protein